MDRTFYQLKQIVSSPVWWYVLCSAAGRTMMFPLWVQQVNHWCDYSNPGLTQSIIPTNRNLLCWYTSFMSTYNTNQRMCKDIYAFYKTIWARLTHIFPSFSLFFLCRNGNLKAQLCSTWSAVSAWTVRPPQALLSSHSVAPRWPARPGSHRWSPEPRRVGEREGRKEQILDPAYRRTQSITSAHCLSPCRGMEGVRLRTVLLWCQLQAPAHCVLVTRASLKKKHF